MHHCLLNTAWDAGKTLQGLSNARQREGADLDAGERTIAHQTIVMGGSPGDQHHRADLKIGQGSRDTREDQVFAAKGREQDRRQGGSVDLADAGLGQNDRSWTIWDAPAPELETGNGGGRRVEREPVGKGVELLSGGAGE